MHLSEERKSDSLLLNRATGHGVDGGLRTVHDVQLLGQDQADPDRTFCKIQFAGNLLIGEAACDEPQQVQFALGQPGHVGGGARVSHAAELVQQLGHQLRLEDRLPARDGTDRLDHLAGVATLEQVAIGTGTDGADDLYILTEHRQHHDAQVGELLAQQLGSGDAVHVGHRDIQQHHVWPMLTRHLDRRCSVAGLSDNADIRLELQKGTQCLPKQHVVVGQEDGDEACHDRFPLLAAWFQPMPVWRLDTPWRGEPMVRFYGGAVRPDMTNQY